MKNHATKQQTYEANCVGAQHPKSLSGTQKSNENGSIVLHMINS